MKETGEASLLEEIRDCLTRIESSAQLQARYARLTMQAVFVLWVLAAVAIFVA